MIVPSEIDRLNKLDLAALIAHDLGPARRAHNGHVYFVCPFHNDHDPSLDVHTAKNKAYCNPCGKSWTPIKWVMNYSRLGFVEACQQLGAANVQPVTVADLPKLDKPYAPPPQVWRDAAAEIVERCHLTLWNNSKASNRVLNYLKRRGLKASTMDGFSLGYNPTAQSINGLFVSAGIVIPSYVAGQLWGIKIRLLPEHPFNCQVCGAVCQRPGACPACGKKNKYRQVKGSEPSLFNADSLRGRRTLFFCEGEFDAMLLEQECYALGSAFTTTNGAGKDWRDGWTGYVLDAERIITLFDNDGAGARGTEKVLAQALGGRVSAAKVPTGKDVTDYVVGGGNVYMWLRDVRWQALSAAFADAGQHMNYLCGSLEISSLPHNLRMDYQCDLDALKESLK